MVYYVNYGSVLAIGIISPVLAVLSLLARLYVWRKSTRTHIDDVLLLPAAVFTIGAGVLVCIGARLHVVGGHSPVQTANERIYSMDPGQITLEKIEYPMWILQTLAIGFSKLSFLFFLRRVFQTRGFRSAFDYVNWTLIVLEIAWMVAFIPTEVFICGVDFGAAWGTYDQLTHCGNSFIMHTVRAVFNWIMDLATLTLPLVMVSRLRMSISQKLQASAAFLLGAFTVGAATTQMVLWILIQEYLSAGSDHKLFGLLGTDELGLVSTIVFWTYIEIGVGFNVACLVTCRTFFEDLGTHIKSLSIMYLKWLSSSTKSGGEPISRADRFLAEPQPHPEPRGADQSLKLPYEESNDKRA